MNEDFQIGDTVIVNDFDFPSYPQGVICSIEGVWAGVKLNRIIHTLKRSSLTKITTIILEIPKCECGNSKNPIGQGHSNWCNLFKLEF